MILDMHKDCKLHKNYIRTNLCLTTYRVSQNTEVYTQNPGWKIKKKLFTFKTFIFYLVFKIYKSAHEIVKYWKKSKVYIANILGLEN